MCSRCARGTQSRNQRYLDNLNLLLYAVLMHALLDAMYVCYYTNNDCSLKGCCRKQFKSLRSFRV